VGGYSTPAAAYENVYFGSGNEPRFYCVDAENGTEVWNITTSANVNGPSMVANGMVYAVTLGSSNNLYAIDAITGKIRWQYGEILPTHSMPAYTPWGNLYITAGYGEAATYCLNAGTGRVICTLRRRAMAF